MLKLICELVKEEEDKVEPDKTSTESVTSIIEGVKEIEVVGLLKTQPCPFIVLLSIVLNLS